MKKLVFVILLGVSCTSTKYTYDTPIKKPKKKLVPFGTVWIKGNLFMDETEVSNFSYFEYLSYLKRQDYTQYIAMVPDTSCWLRADVGFQDSDPLLTNYWKHHAYRAYPAVGISYDQAVAYCQWRTDMVNSYYYTHENKIIFKIDSLTAYLKKARKKIMYRLPTATEWEYASAAGLPYDAYPMGYESLTDKNHVPAGNTLEYYTLYTKTFTGYKDTIFTTEPTVPVFTGKPNRYGLYQMAGNVSEIVAHGLVKGLNFSTPLYTLSREENESGSYTIFTKTYSYKLTEDYKQPEPWLGFRCICEVLEEN